MSQVRSYVTRVAFESGFELCISPFSCHLLGVGWVGLWVGASLEVSVGACASGRAGVFFAVCFSLVQLHDEMKYITLNALKTISINNNTIEYQFAF